MTSCQSRAGAASAAGAAASVSTRILAQRLPAGCRRAHADRERDAVTELARRRGVDARGHAPGDLQATLGGREAEHQHRLSLRTAQPADGADARGGQLVRGVSQHERPGRLAGRRRSVARRQRAVGSSRMRDHDGQQRPRLAVEAERRCAAGGLALVELAVQQLREQVAALAGGQHVLLAPAQEGERDQADGALGGDAIELVQRRVDAQHHQPAPGLAAAHRHGCLDVLGCAG